MNFVNSKFYYVLEKITNFFLLNIIWLLLSLPLITLYPATAAMFAVLRDWRQGKGSGVFRSFLRYFKTYFKHSFLYGLLWFLFAAIFIIDLSLINELEFSANTSLIMTSLLFMLGLIVAFNMIYIIPVTIHFNLSFFGKIKHAFLFSIMYFPTTILCILIVAAMTLLVFLVPALMFIVFSTGSYLIFRLCYRTFLKVGQTN